MSSWTFIALHKAVLALVGQQNQITAREVSDRLGITERYVRTVIRALEVEGYVDKTTVGAAREPPPITASGPSPSVHPARPIHLCHL